MFRIIFSKWGNNKKYILLTVLNAAVCSFLLVFFFNIGFNASDYVKDNFLSGESLRHVLLTVYSDAQYPDAETLLSDERVEYIRFIYGSGIAADSIDGEDFSYAQYTLYGSETGSLLFEGEYLADAPYSESLDDATGGIIVSEQLLGYFDESPLGKTVTFTFEGKEYSLMITAVLKEDAQENLDLSYRSLMYIPAGLLDAEFGSEAYEMAEVCLFSLGDVESFCSDYASETVSAAGNADEAKRLAKVCAGVLLLFVFMGIVLAIAACLGLANCFRTITKRYSRNYAILRTVGFSIKKLRIMNAMETLVIWAASAAAALALMAVSMIFMRNIGGAGFDNIDPAALFEINPGIILAASAAALALEEACVLFAAAKFFKKDTGSVLKGAD